MNRPGKTFFVVSIGLLVLVALLGIINNFAENKIKGKLQEGLKDDALEYEDLEVSLLRRNIRLEGITYKSNGKRLTARQVDLKGIGLVDYLLNQEVRIAEVWITAPEMKILKDQAREDPEGGAPGGIEKSFFIKKLRVESGRLSVSKGESPANEFFASIPGLVLDRVTIDAGTIAKDIPFTYDRYNLHIDSVFYQLDKRHQLFVGSSRFNSDGGKVKRLRILPLYGKREFQRHIPHQLDRYSLQIDQLDFQQLGWKIERDSLMISNPLTRISGVELEVYRDRLQPEDARQKKMYSHMIRDLPLKLHLDTLRLKDVAIRYEERVMEEGPLALVDFEDLYASIYHLSNTGMDREDFSPTRVDVESRFMRNTPIRVSWVFDVRHKEDRFHINGQMGELTKEAMNRFLVPGFGVEAEGNIDRMNFNFRGDHSLGGGTISLVYENFKVEVLREDGRKKNRILSALANLFLKNDSKSGGSKEKNLEVTRDKTKSFWNFLWIMIREGALKAFL